MISNPYLFPDLSPWFPFLLCPSSSTGANTEATGQENFSPYRLLCIGNYTGVLLLWSLEETSSSRRHLQLCSSTIFRQLLNVLNDLKKTCLPFSLSLTTSYIFQFHIFVSFFTYSFLSPLQSTFSPKEATKTTLLRHQSFPDVLVCFLLGVLPHSFLLLY